MHSKSLAVIRDSIRGLRETRTRSEFAVLVLLFLFPLFANTLRHWVSSIFVLIFLISVFSVKWRNINLRAEEKFFLAILAAHVLSVLISNTLTGWTTASQDWIGVEPRYLFAIPIYLYVRRIPEAWKWLILALPLAGVILGLHAAIDFLSKYYQGAVVIIYAEGIYGHIFMGNIAALFSVLSFASRTLLDGKRWYALCLAGAIFSACGAFLSVTRNAWLSLFVLYGLIWIIEMQAKIRWSRHNVLVATGIGVFLLVVLMALFNVSYVKDRLTQVYDEPMAYFNADRSQPMEFTSLGFRLEQWRGAMYAFMEKPVFGHGVGNIGTIHNRYIKEGRLNEVVYQKQAEELGTAAHVHSAFFGYLADTGIVGFAIILLMMLYPTYLALKWRGQSRNAWKFLLLHNVAFLVASLTEIPFIRNNWSSIFLLFNMVFFIWLIDDIKKAQNAHPQRS